MKKLEDLGISPAPWRFLCRDEMGADVRCSWKGIAMKRRHTVVVRDAYIADACLISAAPKLYDAAERLLRFHDESCIHGSRTFEEITKDYKKAMADLKTALADAARESEAANA